MSPRRTINEKHPHPQPADPPQMAPSRPAPSLPVADGLPLPGGTVGIGSGFRTELGLSTGRPHSKQNAAPSSSGVLQFSHSRRLVCFDSADVCPPIGVTSFATPGLPSEVPQSEQNFWASSAEAPHSPQNFKRESFDSEPIRKLIFRIWLAQGGKPRLTG